MVELHVDYSELSEATKAVLKLPGLFERARKSALKSTGWYVQQELRNHVEYGGTNWPALHPLTKKFRHKYGLGSHWVKRTHHPGPLFWLGKFARYRVDADGREVTICFGKSKRGSPGTEDRGLMWVVRRAEEGETIHVTPAMRRFLAATRRKRPKQQEPGRTYFPLKKTTRRLKVPPRPIFGPVFKKVRPKIMPWFERKFWDAFDRYTTGKDKR